MVTNHDTPRIRPQLWDCCRKTTPASAKSIGRCSMVYSTKIPWKPLNSLGNPWKLRKPLKTIDLLGSGGEHLETLGNLGKPLRNLWETSEKLYHCFPHSFSLVAITSNTKQIHKRNLTLSLRKVFSPATTSRQPLSNHSAYMPEPFQEVFCTLETLSLVSYRCLECWKPFNNLL